jgi:signal transduction histidine kinase
MYPRVVKRFAAPIAVLAGAITTFVAAAIVGMGWRDNARILEIVAIGAVIAAPVAMIGFIATRRLSMAAQVGVIACVAVAVSGSGVVAASRAMFVSDHDASVLVVVLLAGATAGVAAAIVFARRFDATHNALQQAARRIGAGELGTKVALDRPATAEMAALAHELDAMSRRLAAARDHEQQLDASRRELVAWLSHDLRSPLTGLVAISEALQDRVVTDEETFDRYLATIRSEAARLADLVDQLFELSLVDTGAVHTEPERVAIDDVISDAVAAARVLADAKHVRFNGVVANDVPIIDGEARGVARILTNLLDNAIRHTPQGGRVDVTLRRDKGGIALAVLDDGPGIAAEEIERVCDRFYRGAGAQGQGSGLGLAIASHIARRHRAAFSVANRASGKGLAVSASGLRAA